MDRADVELLDQKLQVLGRGGAVILAAVAGVAEAAQIDGEDTRWRSASSGMSLWKAHQVSGNPLDQQDRGSAGSHRDIVQRGSVDLDAVVRDARECGTGWCDW